MKKHNKLILILLVILNITIGVIIGQTIGYFLHMKGLCVFTLINVPFMLMCFTDLTNLILFPFAKRTMRKNTEEQEFGKTTTHISSGLSTLKTYSLSTKIPEELPM